MWTTSIALPVSNRSPREAIPLVSVSRATSSGSVRTTVRSFTRDYQSGIPANVLDATRNDVLLANSSGYTADVIMEIEAAAYSGQGYFIDEATGDVYDIRRTFRKNYSNRIQLTGELREHGKI